MRPASGIGGKSRATSPDDPAASGVVGKYLCLQKGDWPAGLKLLAISNDAALAAAAKKELQAPTEAQEILAVADDWWTAAEHEKGPAADRLKAHAARWYRDAEPKLTGLNKLKVQKRLAEAPSVIDEPTAARAPRDPAVDKAIKAVVQRIYNELHPWGHWDTEKPDDKDLPGSATGQQWGGVTAFAVYALTVAGEDSASEPRLKKAIDWLMKTDLKGTYAVSYRIQAIAAMGRGGAQYQSILRQDANQLLAAMQKDGRFSYSARKRESTSDLSCTQYAWIALADAERAGAVKIPPAAWTTIAATLLGQERDGAWLYNSSAKERKPQMTAAGLTLLLLARPHVNDPKMRVSITEGTEAAQRWLADHLEPALPLSGYGYTCLQRAGLAGGVREFGKIDWFADASKKWVTWKPEQGPLTEACFHAAFLARGGIDHRSHSQARCPTHRFLSVP